MNLLIQVCRSDRTGINVKSDKHKATVMMCAIFPDVLALHEPHVGAKRQSLSEAGSRAPTANLGVADETVKVGDLGWIADRAQRRVAPSAAENGGPECPEALRLRESGRVPR